MTLIDASNYATSEVSNDILCMAGAYFTPKHVIILIEPPVN